MSKDKGFTLLELMIAVGLLGILTMLVGPTISNMLKANTKVRAISKIDTSLGKTIEIIKRTSRGAKTSTAEFTYDGVTTSSPIQVYDSGKTLVINKPTIIAGSADSYRDMFIRFRFDDTTKELKVSSTNDYSESTFNTEEVLAEDIESINFRYEQRILVMEIKVTVFEGTQNEFSYTIRDSAVSRIDMDIN